MMLMLERLERQNDAAAEAQAMLEAWQFELHTALPGIVESFDAQRMTVSVQPAIRGAVKRLDGSVYSTSLPLLVDVPVCFPGGGGYSFTFPVKKGDDCLVIFGERCIDAWWQSGGVQEPVEFRMHDLSDGFAIVGVRSQPRVVTGGVATDGAELRRDDGTAKVRLTGTAVQIVAPGGVTIDSPTVTLTGDMITGGFSYLGHTHTGVHGETTSPH
ncbi:MAG: hypothetical protein IJ233_11700 [Pyramidobacter sp.]|nr:hypothetical protein [Pyramidobacter sp.]